jgi:type III pantothenate kinase
MNIIAIDVGNTKIAVGLFLDGQEQFIRSIPGQDQDGLRAMLKEAWTQVPVAEGSKQGKRDGVIVMSSVNPKWADRVQKAAKDDLGEKVKIVGKEVPLPMPVWVDEPDKVGTDRVVSAAAAYDVVEGAVVVADFGTAVTIDLVDQNGAFQGGVILPGFDLSASTLHEHTAMLPGVKVTRPTGCPGKNTADAINCGLYYGAIGALEEIVRRYAEQIGTWPQVVMTGSGGDIIREDCPFVDNYVPNLVVKGIVLAYMKTLEDQTDQA